MWQNHPVVIDLCYMTAKGLKSTQSTPEAVRKPLKRLDSPERKKAASELVYSVIQEASLPIANAIRMLLFAYHMDR